MYLTIHDTIRYAIQKNQKLIHETIHVLTTMVGLIYESFELGTSRTFWDYFYGILLCNNLVHSYNYTLCI